MNIDTIDHFGKVSGIFAFMNTAWGWPFIESLHYIALAVLIGTVGLFDLRMLGLAKAIPLSSLHRIVPFGVFAYAANIITGAMFFVSAPDQYAYNPAFQLKVLCMVTAGANVAVFYTTTAHTVKALQANTAAPLHVKVIAGVSLASWVGVIIFGRLITYFRPPFHWCFWC
jgi:hypothetical protein